METTKGFMVRVVTYANDLAYLPQYRVRHVLTVFLKPVLCTLHMDKVTPQTTARTRELDTQVMKATGKGGLPRRSSRSDGSRERIIEPREKYLPRKAVSL